MLTKLRATIHALKAKYANESKSTNVYADEDGNKWIEAYKIMVRIGRWQEQCPCTCEACENLRLFYKFVRAIMEEEGICEKL